MLQSLQRWQGRRVQRLGRGIEASRLFDQPAEMHEEGMCPGRGRLRERRVLARFAIAFTLTVSA